MRRHGASHAAKRARVDVPTKTYPSARRKLNELLKSFCFVKVSEVTQVPPKDGRPEFFHGVACTQSNSRFDASTERVFFDKGGRLRYNATFDVGPCKLIDAAWGRDHPSAIPQIGDILVGVLENNTRTSKGSARIPKVLRSWSRHGKIIMELSRMVEFGTSVSEFDTRQMLRQAECAMIEQARAAEALGAHNVSRVVQNGSSSADDFWMLARLILWGNVRPLVVLHSMQTGLKCKMEPSSAELLACAELKLSCSAYEYLSGLAFKLEDAELMKDFTDSLEVITKPPTPKPQASFTTQFGYGLSAPIQEVNNQVYSSSGNITPPFIPSSPSYQPKSPAYMPESPIYSPADHTEVKNPDSPVYRPSSPTYSPPSPEAAEIPKAESKAPDSPPYRPASPPPNSPRYSPPSPVQTTDLTKFMVSYADV